MDKQYIQSLIQLVLNREFTIPSKKRINVYHDRLQMACPYCGDSATNISAKRGNLYFNKLLYICFNCGHKRSLDNLLRDYEVSIDLEKKMEMIEYLSKNITYTDYEQDFMDSEFDDLVNLDELSQKLNDGSLAITEFQPIVDDGEVYNYLVSRGINKDLHQNIYQAKYWINENRWDKVIVLLNRKKNKILGMQIRNLKSGKNRLFKIYNFETIYKWVKEVDEIQDIDLNQVLIFNKISYYFNILNVDLSDTITIFEGYLDSLFFPNSIGLVGTNSDMHFLEQNNLDIRYLYDNDDAGNIESQKKIRAGFSVFLWSKLFDFIVSNKKSSDPYKLTERISKVKDLNTLAQLSPNPYKKFNLEEFFSRDIYDEIWLKKPEKRKFNPTYKMKKPTI